MTHLAPESAAGHPRRATRLMGGLLLLAIGAAAGMGAGLALPGAAGADPSPAASPAAESLPEGFEAWRKALGIIREHYVDPSVTTDRNLVEGSIRGMVDALGDTGHTVFLTKEQKEAERDVLDGTVIGIGVTVDARNGSPTIISVLGGSPADRAGLRPGDVILAVDGQRTDRSGTDELVRLVRGEVGTTVTLRIRGRAGKVKEVSIVRERVELPAVSWAMVPGTRVAVIRLNQFSEGAGAAIEEAARAALEADAAAIVLDLRGNPGGLLNEAVRVASAFLGQGTVFRSVDRGGVETSKPVTGEAVVPDLPMAVLIDYGSASSAEIVAAALQESGRARLIGEPTYGTDTILQPYDLPGGAAIRLGVERWLTPTGRDVYDTGVTPDIEVALPSDGRMLDPDVLRTLTKKGYAASTDRQLRRAVRLLTSGGPSSAPA